MSARAFALKCGLKGNTFTNQMNGVRELSLSTVNSILFSFEDISSEWLLRGKGDMLLSHEQTSEENERVNKLIDTIAFLQCTVSEQKAHIDRLEEEKKRLIAENVMLKNEKRII